ncbi:hypothetical protein PIN31115_05393 [Pandoraea iniqua]|uniref:Uncharacterized protein n=1 Tax=Pandoraea iniqua TaxID=2508288 RepID=A0A5E4ZCI5_9BURK|nr:hypothetical protein [Pandoraea iniqua]VVE58784.1 hypothetical protein PIN31115_05393 [Pandoraea iniqua]
MLPVRPARAGQRAAVLFVTRFVARLVMRVAALFALGAAASSAAHAAGNYCQHATFEGTSVERMTVCVRRQAFDNDVYVLRLDGKTALRGTDDEVAHGVFGRVGNRLVAMRCEAEESPARVSPAVAQALSWQTGVRVQRITDALGSVETGRRCTVKIDGADAGLLTFAFN